MIRTEPGEAPDILASDRVREARLAAEKFYKQSKARRAQLRHEFGEKIFVDAELLDALHATFFSKCAFCESPAGVVGDLFCGHYRPFDGALDLEGNFEPDPYWWLAYEWENLYLICGGCQQSKGNRFPIGARNRASAGATGTALEAEAPVLIDPRNDQPEDLFVYGRDGNIAASGESGIQSIEVLRLDRVELRKAREQAFADIEAELDDLGPPDTIDQSVVDSLLDKTPPYAGLRRHVVLRWLEDAAAPERKAQLWEQVAHVSDIPLPDPAGESIASKAERTQEEFSKYRASRGSLGLDSDGAVSSEYFLTTQAVEHIEIRNFAIIKELNLDLRSYAPSGSRWLTLLGENGTGKSSILHSVALALLDREYRDSLGLDASEYVTHGEKSGHIRVWLSALDAPVELRFSTNRREFDGGPDEAATLVLAYGATRLLPRPNSTPARGRSYARVDNLFNPFVPLRDAEEWLLALSQSKFDVVARSIKRMMDLRGDARLRRRTDRRTGRRRVVVDAFGDKIPLGRLSDGYQSVVALAADVMAVMSERWSDMQVAEGLVLIDELGAHLHPEWQMRIVSALREAFPRVQFITTTHSPLCLRGLEDGEVVVMKRDLDQGVFALRDLPSVKGLRVDQLLLSDHFGLLGGTEDPEVARRFDEYYALLAIEDPSAVQRSRLGELKDELEFAGLAGELPREQLMYDAIDQYLARRAVALRSEADDETEASVLQALTEILDAPAGGA